LQEITGRIKKTKIKKGKREKGTEHISQKSTSEQKRGKSGV
jgi:hypothetical protein